MNGGFGAAELSCGPEAGGTTGNADEWGIGDNPEEALAEGIIQGGTLCIVLCGRAGRVPQALGSPKGAGGNGREYPVPTHIASPSPFILMTWGPKVEKQ